MTLHEFLDHGYAEGGDDALRQRLSNGAETDERDGPHSETPLHVATRRRRAAAAAILLDHGADIDAKTAGSKTPYAHAVRRGLDDLAELLADRGASADLNDADRLAVAVVNGRLDQARQIAADYPESVRTGNPEQDRLLADVAGRNETAPVALLIELGADLTATGLDDGTPLHQAAWFGQPGCARLLIDAGAPLDVFDRAHTTTPLGWAVHGSRYSGGAEQRQEAYVELVRMLLEAGSSLQYPDDPRGGAYLKRLLEDASPSVGETLRQAG